MARMAPALLQQYCEQVHQEAKQQVELLPKEKAVHQLRLCSKRLRAAWQFLHSAHPMESLQRQRQLKLIAQPLSEQRDHSVRLRWLKQLCPEVLEQLPDSEPLTDKILSSMVLSALSLQLKLDRQAWEKQTVTGLAKSLKDTLGKGRRLTRTLTLTSPSEKFHRLRKWAKCLQYQQEIIQQPLPEVNELTKTLGDKHDLDLLLVWLERHQRQYASRCQLLITRLEEKQSATRKKQQKRRAQIKRLKRQLRALQKALRAVQKEERKLTRLAVKQAQAFYLPRRKKQKS